MAPEYKNYPTGVLFSSAFNTNVTPPLPRNAKPSYPNPVQGTCLCNCPFIAGLESIAWVNRNFILKTISGSGPLSGNYTVYFWDYPGLKPPYPVPIGQNIPLQLNAGTDGPVKTPVVVAGTIPLDEKDRPVDPATGYPYGAGSTYRGSAACTNEYWPSLYEKAYAKFCLYKAQVPVAANKNLPLRSGDLADPLKDPTFSEVMGLTPEQWGGNPGIGLMYMTPQKCWQYDLQSSYFTGGGGVSCSATGDIFTYLKTAFCSQNSLAVKGLNKTMYPLVAWTYPSEDASPAGRYDAERNKNGILYTNIVNGHCYPVLGVYSSASGKYIVIRTTYGVQDPNQTKILSQNPPTPNYPRLARQPEVSAGTFYDPLFKIGTIASGYPPSASPAPNNISIDFANGIFGIDGSTLIGNTGLTMFQLYFQSIAWAQG